MSLPRCRGRELRRRHRLMALRCSADADIEKMAELVLLMMLDFTQRRAHIIRYAAHNTMPAPRLRRDVVAHDVVFARSAPRVCTRYAQCARSVIS